MREDIFILDGVTMRKVNWYPDDAAGAAAAATKS